MDSGFGKGALLGGRYRLQRVLGTGGMASVWLADDERLGRRVAVKLLADTLALEESYLTRFRREARLAAGLSHPSLVMVYDFGGEGVRPYLVMEYVEGESLAERIAAETAADLDAGRLARELLGALAHIHAAGIVHRDIKPANVLITLGGKAKVTDFGIAQPEDATRLTSTGLVIGTRSYMAPEVVRGDSASPRSDLYSCAIVLEEAFGTLLSPGLASVLKRLADEDPARRPDSAAQALAELAGPTESLGAEETLTATTEPLPPKGTAATVPIDAATTSARPGPRLLGGLALLAALIVLGIVLLGGGDDPPSPSGDGSGDRRGEESSGQGTAPESADEGTAEEQPAVTETTPAEEPAPVKPEKIKPEKAPKAAPGKAKGLGKH